MSLYGMMRTGVSGMQGQASKLSTIADNIANANTNGYKRFSTEFSTLVVNAGAGNYNSGGVVTSVRQAVSQQGVLQFSNSASDLAIDGAGFFVVQDASGNSFLTRAGSFVPDADGSLINAAGFYLAGYSYENGEPSVVVNSFDGLEPVAITGGELEAVASTEARFAANLPAEEPVVTGTLASANTATSEYTEKTSMVVYNNLGGETILDIYYTKTASNTWEVSVFDQADAAPGTSFPYATGPLSTQTLTFDNVTGQMTGPTSMTVPVPNGLPMNLDMTGMTQLATGFVVSRVDVNGYGPATIERVDFGSDGIVYAQYTNGTTEPLFRIPTATVNSPDQLRSLSGNVFTQSDMSGSIRLGFPDEGGAGAIVSGAVETSNVDIAEELTEMIQSQRNYTANSKVFQTGSDLMDVLLNLKR
ncbi:flagellar hook protein FlgE [Oricola cellulosilytica]|uniref:Flagellar hook protein FlgE n=1 Tax=Oricola cellulosilytica TaxID=1429082 RepID=A0A4R0PEH9_9HYPH|nr:flagellar hook protein FlgE [Oricola cellulosilytica]TCD16215.1 flagellar hook protein FlgE [Oricola cellulosilytica]